MVLVFVMKNEQTDSPIPDVCPMIFLHAKIRFYVRSNL